MRFTRPAVRYSRTPCPVTPYQAAAQAWDERIGSARVQARNWRLMAFGCLALATLLGVSLAWRAGTSSITPYVVEVDQSGTLRAVGEAATAYHPTDAQISHHLAAFIGMVRALSSDPIVVRRNWLGAYATVTDHAATVLNDYARTQDPFSRIGKESVTVEVTSVVRASNTSFQIRWIERPFINGAPAEETRWTAIVGVVVQTPRTEAALRRNPLGIYVDSLAWSREFDTAPGARKP